MAMVMLPMVEFPAGGENLTLTLPLQQEDESILDLSSATSVELMVNTYTGVVVIVGIVVNGLLGICRFTLGKNNILGQGTGPIGYEARVMAKTVTQDIPSKWFKIVVI